MPAQIGRCIGWLKVPDMRVVPDEIIDAPGLAFPFRILPWLADRRSVFEPWQFCGDLFQLVPVAELMPMAGAVYAKQAVLSRHGRAARFPILINSADVADIGRNAGHGGQQEVILPATA